MNDNENASKSYIKPWTLRAFDALPGNPLWIGIGFAGILLLAFFIGRVIVADTTNSPPGDFRLAIIHILLTTYTASAYAYLITAARKSAQDLQGVIRHEPQWQSISDRVGTHLWWGLVLAGLMSILLYIYATIVTTTGGSPWDWTNTNYDARWMRILGIFLSWWGGCLLFVLVVESARLSKLSGGISDLDLLDLRPYQPLIRQGLTNTLLVVGMASILSLFLFEPGFAPVLIRASIVCAIFAWIGLMLPLSGIRRKISIAKEQELDWCRDALKSAREQLKAGTGAQQSIAEISAYKTMIEDIRNWPFDNPTLTRFALYLLIPLASMFGGAIVERGLELFLF